MRRWLIILVAALAVSALVAAGCGGSNSSSSNNSASTTGGALTGQQIADKSAAAMQAVKSSSFTLDATVTVKGQPSATADAQTKALFKAPITLSAQGSISNEPQKTDITLNAALAGQKFDVGLKTDADKIWVQFMNQWYETTQSALGGLTGSSAAPSASPAPLTQQLQDAVKTLGIDPTTWTQSYTIAGTESLGGTDVYHVVQTLDVSKLVDDLLKLSQTASGLTGGLGGSSSATPTPISSADAQQLKDALKGLKIDWYFQKDNSYLRKMVLASTIDLSSDPTAQKDGVTGVDLSVTLTLDKFDQPVTVTPPASTKPLQDLIQALMGASGSGGLLGGLGG
jgi:hypothetical protein